MAGSNEQTELDSERYGGGIEIKLLRDVERRNSSGAEGISATRKNSSSKMQKLEEENVESPSPGIDTSPQHHDLNQETIGSTVAPSPEPTIDPKEYTFPSRFTKKWYDVRPYRTFRDENIAKLRKIYRKQRCHYIQEEDKRYDIGIWISKEVKKMYVKILEKHAIPEINDAVPGIHLQQKQEKCECLIHIYNTNEDEHKTGKFEEKAFARNNIHPNENSLAEIYLGDKFVERLPVTKHLLCYKRVCVHELLHALGLEHTHQIRHAGSQLECAAGDPAQEQPREDILGIVRFDPFSIMLYPYDTSKVINKYDPVWRVVLQKDPYIHVNFHMSELDKVALNYIFPPCRHADYDPQWNPQRNMYYCKRYVMSSHNKPIPEFTSCCGFDNKGPNCPACRTLKHPDVINFPENTDLWQGWSGMIYCWKKMNKNHEDDHDGYCGPDYGYACSECKALLYSDN